LSENSEGFHLATRLSCIGRRDTCCPLPVRNKSRAHSRGEVRVGRLVSNKMPSAANSIGSICNDILLSWPCPELRETMRIAEAAPRVAIPVRIWNLAEHCARTVRTLFAKRGISNSRRYGAGRASKEVCPAGVRVDVCHQCDLDLVMTAIIRRRASVRLLDHAIDSGRGRPFTTCRSSR